MRRLLCIVFVAATGGGCLDLSLPSKQPPDLGPTVSFASPAAGDILPLTAFVQLDVTSLHGVSDLSLRCNGVSLQDWRGQSPFEGVVDFSLCASTGTPVAGDGGAVVAATLLAVAVDDTGVAGPAAQVSVVLDVSAPVLTLNAPSRVAPGGSLTATITSDRPLTTPPLVEVQGAPAQVTGNASGLSFVATLSPLPQLGVDAYDAGAADADVPIDVLEDVERPLLLTVDARGANGNATHLTYQLLLSRILWEKPVPGVITAAPDAGFLSVIACSGEPLPTAAASGLQLPLLAALDPFNQGFNICLPGFMSAADGTFTPPTDAMADAGRVVAFDNTGRTLLTNGVRASFLEAQTGVDDVTAPLALELAGRRLVELGAQTACQEQQSQAACTSTLRCLTPAGAVNSTFATFPFDPWLELTSGDVYLAWSLPGLSCAVGTNCQCLDELFVGRLGAMTPVLSPLNGNFPGQVLPVDGGFVLAYINSAGAQTANLLLPSGALGPQTWDPGAAAEGGLFAAFPNGRLLTFQTFAQAGTTQFIGWDPNTVGFSVSSRIPGVLSPPVGLGPVGYWATNKALAVLVTIGVASTPNTGVVLFDSNLRPRWLYRYPRPVTPAQMQLVGDPTGQLLYLVDLANEYVVALPQ